MYVKELLLQALSRANHIEDGTPADARELNKARNHLNSALTRYSDANLITAFQRVLTMDGAEEITIGKYNLKRGKVMHEADGSSFPDATRLTIGKDYCHDFVTDRYYTITDEGGSNEWTEAEGQTGREQLVNLGICDYIPDVIVPCIERITSAMEKRKEDKDLPYHKLEFVPLAAFYTNDAWDIYCSVPLGDNKVKLYLPKNLIGHEVRVVYYASMKLKNDDYIELPEVYKELLTLAVTVGLLSEDADSDPSQLANYTAMMTALESQVMSNNANTRRIVRTGDRHIRPLYTGQFIYGRFVP